MKTRLAVIQRAALILLLLLAINYQLSAQAQGTAFTYQGRLNDGANPANGIYDLRFALYDLSSGGSQAGPILTNAVTASNGLFMVALDFGANVLTNMDRFLEIAMRTNGGENFTTLSPRQKLTPAPYAIFAENVGAGGLTAGTNSNAITFNNSVNNFSGNGAGLTGLNAGSLSSGALSDARLSANVALRAGGNTFNGNQTVNGQIRMDSPDGFSQSSQGNFGVDAPFIIGGRVMVLTNGNVGIGTNNPNTKLHVIGGATIKGNMIVGGDATVNGGATVTGTVIANALTLGSGGTSMSRILSTTAFLDFPDTLAQETSDLTIVLTGAALGDAVFLGVPNNSVSLGAGYSAWVSSANTVTVRFLNSSSGASNPASGLFRVGVLQF